MDDVQEGDMDRYTGAMTFRVLPTVREVFLRSDIWFPLFLGIIALYILFGIDIITTEAILILDGVELNSLMAAVVASPIAHIAVKGSVLIFIAGVYTWAEERIARSGISAMAVIIAFYVIIALHNTGTLWLMTQAG